MERFGRKKRGKRPPHTHFMKMRKYIRIHSRVFLRVSRRALRVYNVNNYAAAVAVAAKAAAGERKRKETFL
jgi:hypothetical protein